MGKLIDESLLQEKLALIPMEERTFRRTVEELENAPTVESIPKDQYEARLKADLVAMLKEIQLEIEEEKQDTKHLHYDDLESAESYNIGIDNCIDTIQQKINALKAESEDKE